MTTVVNFRDVKEHWNKETQQWDSDEYVYIGRRNHTYNLPASPFANYFAVSVYGRPEAIRKYKGSIVGKIASKHVNLESLRGKTLICWCKPAACHGDVLVELLAETDAAQ